ncbi:hypothetical protein CEXT_88291 [Caerostris extrusa]|uniref:Uncharacterized protein n=1 Tax=Caerostris extrusa TaxID=172846 RepID=A0AAV4UG63_CAEEX|nr:hypothetical protein CEXT_88291 [Caerostris extrusa]
MADLTGISVGIIICIDSKKACTLISSVCERKDMKCKLKRSLWNFVFAYFFYSETFLLFGVGRDHNLEKKTWTAAYVSRKSSVV